MSKFVPTLHYRKKYLVFSFIVFLTLFRLLYPRHSVYSKEDTMFVGEIIDYTLREDSIRFTFSAKEKILATYYFQEEKEKQQWHNMPIIGMKVKLFGKLTLPAKSTTKNIWDYQKYLKQKHIFYLLSVQEYQILSFSSSIYDKIKNKIQFRIACDPYLSIFLLGDLTYLSSSIKTSYQENGISHLFSLSGMHIHFFTSFFLFLFRPFFKKKKWAYLPVNLLLLIYFCFISFSPSALRGMLFFFFASWQQFFKISSCFFPFFMSLAVSLLLCPSFLFQVGFLYSYVISFFLILTREWLVNGGYWSRLLKTSVLCFGASFPISLFFFYQVNILSIVYNLFYVPFVSLFLFPFSFIVFFFPKFLPFYHIFTSFLENSSLLLQRISLGKVVFPKIFTLYYLLYFLFFFTFLLCRKKQKKIVLLVFIVFLSLHYFSPVFSKSYVKMIDVGQGDAILFHSQGENVLVDTGGVFSKEGGYSLSTSLLLPLLKSLGVRKLDYLVLTHGDLDHVGEAFSLIKNIPITHVLINLGELNEREIQIIKNHPQVIQAKQGYGFSCGEFFFTQLNREFVEENDSSQVYYVTYKNKKILLMGDASKRTEEYLLQTYMLPKIDILKVAHHGSNTSTSKSFLQKIQPDIALISVGRNNLFHHPHKDVLRRLKDFSCQIYETKKFGTITIFLDTNKIIWDV